MTITTYQPRNPVLRSYISYYYHQEYTHANATLKYQCFPHLNLSISLFERAHFRFEQGSSFVSYHPLGKPLTLLTLVRATPLWVNHQGPLRKIAIVFEPLGLQALSRQSLLSLIRGSVTPIDPFGGQLTQLIPTLFAAPTIDDWVTCLDQFFLPLVRSIAYPVLPHLVHHTTQLIESTPLHQIAHQHRLSRRHMSRLFQHYLGCSPETYRQIARFRRVLELATQPDRQSSFTELAYLTGHADQAHWNKQCRKWSGYAPNDLLTLGSSLGQQALFWRLIQDEHLF